MGGEKTHEAIRGASKPSHTSGGNSQDAKGTTEKVVCKDHSSLVEGWMDCKEKVTERQYHQWRQQAAVSPDLRRRVCLFQINSPYDDALKDNLWGIKDRHIGSAPTTHPSPWDSSYSLLLYFLSFHIPSSLIFFYCHLVCTLFAYLLIWQSHCLTTPSYSTIVFLSSLFICHSSSSSTFISSQLHLFHHPSVFH